MPAMLTIITESVLRDYAHEVLPTKDRPAVEAVIAEDPEARRLLAKFLRKTSVQPQGVSNDC